MRSGFLPEMRQAELKNMDGRVRKVRDKRVLQKSMRREDEGDNKFSGGMCWKMLPDLANASEMITAGLGTTGDKVMHECCGV